MNQQNKRPRLSTPKPDASFNPTADEFAAWCEHPTTRWVASAYAKGIEANKAAWAALLEMGDDATLAVQRATLRTRADAYGAFLDTNHSDYLIALDPQAWKGTYGEARD